MTAPPTVVLSFGAWQTRFGGSPDVLGRTVALQSPWLSVGEPHVIVGVPAAGLSLLHGRSSGLLGDHQGSQRLLGRAELSQSGDGGQAR